MTKVGLIYFFLAIAVACLIGVISIKFFGVDDNEFRQALEIDEEADVE